MTWSRWLPPPLLTAALVSLGVFLVATEFTTVNLMAEIIRGILLPLASAVVIAYGIDAFKGLFQRRPAGISQLLIGIVCSWLGMIGTAAYVLLWRLAGQPMWMLNSEVPNMFAALTLFGAALHLTAPGTLNGVPRVSALWLAACAGLTVAGFTLWVFLHPDVRPLTESLRPYLEERPKRSLSDPFGVRRWNL